ncbi:anti-adapter protein iraM [Kosakonia sp. YIM B13611]|uniref:anti-adapter protein iraM n=1 Tax=unclassified Kosakonia TaxID=2632876 RepID=UPI0036AAAC9E
MRWDITDMLLSPTTGTAFAVARNSENLSVIVWYRGNYFLRPNNHLHTDGSRVSIDGKLQNFRVIHTMPFFPAIWRTLKNSCHCPGNDNVSLRNCEKQQTCLFELCPYGIKMIS